MVFNEAKEFESEYLGYFDAISKPENQDRIKKAKQEMQSIKSGNKFLFTPRFLPWDALKDPLERCKKTIEIINQILKENREGEKTPLSDIIPRRRQYNIPRPDLYERVIDLVDPKFPSIMESRIDGCINHDKRVVFYEINANRAGWENSRSFCDIYNKYFSHLFRSHSTMDFADGWESIIRYALKKLNGSKVIYLTEQRGKESINALRERGIDIDFVRYQNIKKLLRSGELEITKDDVVYRGERVDIICRFLRTHQVLEIPELCRCVKNGNVHLINQMDAFFGGLKTLLIKLNNPDEISSYARPDEIIEIPESRFLRDLDKNKITENKDEHVLKFGNCGGGKRVYFGSDFSGVEWKNLLINYRKKYPETAMIQKFVKPSITPHMEGGKVLLHNTSSDFFITYSQGYCDLQVAEELRPNVSQPCFLPPFLTFLI